MSYGFILTHWLYAYAMSEVTSAQIKKNTWARLNRLKEPGDSMDDVINRLLDEYEPVESDGGREVPASS